MSCLFKALINGVPKTPKPHHLTLRNSIVNYISTDPEIVDRDMKMSQAIQWLDRGDLKTYCQKMRSSSEWGGAIEIHAFTRLYNVNVNVTVVKTGKIIEFKSLHRGSRVIEIKYNGHHYYN